VAEYTLTNSGSSAALQQAYTWGLDLSGSMQGAGGVGGMLCIHRVPGTDGSGNRTWTDTFYPTYDGNGNVSEYLDKNGAEVAHFEYDPFGRVVHSTGTPALFTYRFSTKPLDFETGLYYYLYRYYDPITGRWPSRDPIEEEGGMNLYEFVGNDGVRYYDILGLIVTTQEDEAYRKKILACFNCCGDFEWIEDKSIVKTPRSNDTFSKKATWFKLKKVKDNVALQNEIVCKTITAAINDDIMYYLSKLTPNLKTGPFEDKINAGGSPTGNPRGIHLSDKSIITIPVQKLDGQKNPVTKDGKPVYVNETQDFCSTLWHEFAGHSVAEINAHPTNGWNDYVEVERRDPIGKGKSDPSIEIENQYRKLRGWPLRRPQYWDVDHRP
jgi:RHS repeat-associated protein